MFNWNAYCNKTKFDYLKNQKQSKVLIRIFIWDWMFVVFEMCFEHDNYLAYDRNEFIILPAKENSYIDAGCE